MSRLETVIVAGRPSSDTRHCGRYHDRDDVAPPVWIDTVLLVVRRRGHDVQPSPV